MNALPYILGAFFVVAIFVGRGGDNLTARCGTCGGRAHAWSTWTHSGPRCPECRQPAHTQTRHASKESTRDAYL